MKFLMTLFSILVIYNSAQGAKVSSSQSVADCQTYRLCIHVSKGTQTMSAYLNVDGMPIALGVVMESNRQPKFISTARAGKSTPTGTFNIEEVAGRNRVSTRYNGAALYYALQIQGNIFIHATSPGNYNAFGGPASAGCIRTDLETAEFLNQVVRDIRARTGSKRDIRVVVTDA